MLLSAPLIIPPYEIMQLQTSIRSCEGNHYVVTVINDAAENSGLLSNNPCAQGAFEGRGPVAKETDDIQNGPRSTVLHSSLSLSLFLPTNRFLFFSPSFFFFFAPSFVSKAAAARPLKVEFFGGGWKVFPARRLGATVQFMFVSVLIS